MDFFFDLDGPILDVSEKYYRVYAGLLRDFGAVPLPKADYWEAKRNRVPDAETLGRSGAAGRLEEYRSRRISLIETAPYWAYDSVWPGMLEILKLLALKHPLYLVTLRTQRASLMQELQHLGLASCFRMVLSTPADGAAGRSNVKAELVRSALGKGPFSGWFIGDTETDILAGKELALNTIGVSFGIRSREFLLAAKADDIIETPGELCRRLPILTTPS